MTTARVIWGPGSIATGKVSLQSYPLNDADDSVAFIFFVPKAGTITHVGARCTAVVGDPPAYNVGLVTVTAATGAPTTTAYGGSTNTTKDYTAAGFEWVALAVAATAVVGDLVAARIWPTASVPDASNYASMDYGGLPAVGSPRIAYYTTTWNDLSGYPAMAVKYDDGTVYGMALTGWTDEAIESDTTPDEAGAVFTLPADMTCTGARASLALVDASAPFTIKLYDAANSLLASAAIADEDSIVGVGQFEVHWTPVNLTAGATYRLTILSDSATLGFTPLVYVFESAASLANNILLPEAARWQKTERTDAGAWTETDTQCPHMALIISDITFSAAAAATGGAWAHMG